MLQILTHGAAQRGGRHFPGRLRRSLLSILAVVALAVPLFGSFATPASAWVAGDRIWGRSQTLYYCLSAAVTARPGFISVIQGAMTQWNGIMYNVAPIANYSTTVTSCSGYGILVNQASLSMSACGVTTSTGYAGFFYTSTVKYNTNKTYYWYPSTGDCDIENLTTHELGHSWGLSDSSVTNSVMYGSNSHIHTLQADDIKGFQCIYYYSGSPISCP